MSIHQVHFDRKFYLDKKKGYWISTDYSEDKPRIRAHQWVWINVHGNIPKGYHVHHIDDNKSNNSIENLELIHGKRHMSHHMRHYMLDPVKKKKAKENFDKIRILTKKWHGSEEGKLWHKYHAKRFNFANWEPIEKECEICGKKYKTKKRSRAFFCSNKCRAKNRRKIGVDNIERNCAFCNKTFNANKYSKTFCCSLNCSAKNRWEKRRQKNYK